MSQCVAAGLTNALHLFNPDLVVLGGGVTIGLNSLGYLERIRSMMNERAMSPGYREFSLVPSQFGDNVGMMGAAALVWQFVPPNA